MNINKNCDFCNKELNNKLIYDAYYYVKDYREDFDKYENTCIFITTKNKFTCNKCLKEYISFINMNKFEFIRKRQIYGSRNKLLKLPLKDPKKIKYIFGDLKEHCYFCNKKLNISINTSIHQRNNYIEGLGQFCGSCFGNYL